MSSQHLSDKPARERSEHPICPVSKVTAQASRYQQAVEWLSAYPGFERTRLLAKRAELRNRLAEQSNRFIATIGVGSLMQAYTQQTRWLDEIVDNKLFHCQLAMAAVRLYDSMPTRELLTSIEQYVTILAQDY